MQIQEFSLFGVASGINSQRSNCPESRRIFAMPADNPIQIGRLCVRYDHGRRLPGFLPQTDDRWPGHPEAKMFPNADDEITIHGFI